MKIIVILHRDSENLFIENIIRRLDKRHELKIFAVFQDKQSLYMFDDLKTSILPYSECTDEIIAWSDITICTLGSIGRVACNHKYVFLFCNHIPMLISSKGIDFVFLTGPSKTEAVPYFASMPVGLSKNDTAAIDAVETTKQILYIDCGHYPFSKEGKRQIAKMLVDVCHAYPDYSVCIKPRWFPDANADMMTHQNFDHIYSIFAEMYPDGLPKNLNLSMEHENLQNLIDKSACILSLCTTAYLDVALRGKPLLILRGFDNDSTYILNNSFFEAIYNNMEGSGCVIPYRDVLRYLPEGLLCNPEHIKCAFSYLSGATDRSIEVMEYVFENVLSQGKLPDIKQYDFECYKEQFAAPSTLTREDLLANRYFVLTKAWGIVHQRLESKTFDVVALDKILLQMSRAAALSLQPLSAFKRDVIQFKTEYLWDRFDQLNSEMDRYQLYSLLFQADKFDELLKIEKQQLGILASATHSLLVLTFHPNPVLRKPALSLAKIFAKSCSVDPALNYFLASIYQQRKNSALTRIYLNRYFEKFFSRNYPKYREEKGLHLLRAFVMMFKALSRENDGVSLNEYVCKYLQIQKSWYPAELIPSNPKTRVLFERITVSLRDAGYTITAEKMTELLSRA